MISKEYWNRMRIRTWRRRWSRMISKEYWNLEGRGWLVERAGAMISKEYWNYHPPPQPIDAVIPMISKEYWNIFPSSVLAHNLTTSWWFQKNIETGVLGGFYESSWITGWFQKNIERHQACNRQRVFLAGLGWFQRNIESPWVRIGHWAPSVRP